jgi:hypothetical protein
MLMNIHDEVAQQLERVAQEQGIPVDDLLRTLLSPYSTKYATLADLAQNALEAGIASQHPVDTAANSREILKSEYAEYLKRRLDSDDNHNG